MPRKPSERLRGARKRTKKAKAKSRARKLRRRRNIRRKKKKAKEAAEPITSRARAAKKEGQQTRQEAVLLASEFGVTPERAQGAIDQANTILNKAEQAGGGALDQLDFDGDGDTDILNGLEQQFNPGSLDNPNSLVHPLTNPAAPVLEFKNTGGKSSHGGASGLSGEALDGSMEKDLLGDGSMEKDLLGF